MEFSPMRLDEIKKLIQKKKIKISYKDFTVSEIKYIISETCLSDSDRQIAELKYIRKFTNDQIGEKMGMYNKSTVINHLKKISLALRTTGCRIFK